MCVYFFIFAMHFWCLVCLLLTLFCWKLSESLDISLTLSIPPRKRECFHETVNEGVEYEVEYQVVICFTAISRFVLQHDTENKVRARPSSAN